MHPMHRSAFCRRLALAEPSTVWFVCYSARRTDSVSTARNPGQTRAPGRPAEPPVRASWSDKGDRLVGLNPLGVESQRLNFSDLPLHYGCRWGYLRAPSGQ
jgi:hypothetical protein